MNDIEILEEILNRQIEDTEGTKIMKQAIENLINKNKELEEENKILKNKQTKIIADSFHEKMAEKFDEEFIPKSKAIEMINKLGTYREKHFYFRKDLSKAQHDKSMKMLGGIEYLEELLQEGDK